MSKIKNEKIEGHNFSKCMDEKIKSVRNCLNNNIMWFSDVFNGFKNIPISF